MLNIFSQFQAGKRYLLLLTLTFIFSAALFAQPISDQNAPTGLFNTLYGPVGLISVPTAYVTPVGNAMFSMAIGNDNRTVGVNYGLAPSIDIGGAFIDREGNDNKIIANAKINIVPANFNWFTVGAGVIDGFDAIDQTVYVVASAKWEVPEQYEKSAMGLRLHVGAGTGIFHEDIIGGAEILLNKQFSVAGEWDGDDLNGAVRYIHDKNFRLQVGFLKSEGYVNATYLLTF